MYTYSSIYADVLELPFYVPPRYAQTGADHSHITNIGVYLLPSSFPPRYAQTGADFAFKSGVQMAAVRAMIKAVSGI